MLSAWLLLCSYVGCWMDWMVWYGMAGCCVLFLLLLLACYMKCVGFLFGVESNRRRCCRRWVKLSWVGRFQGIVFAHFILWISKSDITALNLTSLFDYESQMGMRGYIHSYILCFEIHMRYWFEGNFPFTFTFHLLREMCFWNGFWFQG